MYRPRPETSRNAANWREKNTKVTIVNRYLYREQEERGKIVEFGKVMERIRVICENCEVCGCCCPFWTLAEGCIISIPDGFSTARIREIEAITESCTRAVYPKWCEAASGQAVEVAVKMGYPVITLDDPIPEEIARKCGIKPKIEVIQTTIV